MAKLTLQSYQKRWEIKWKQRSWKQILRTTSPPPTFKLVRFLFSFSFFFLCVCVVRFLDKSRLVAWIERENVFPSQLPKHNLQKETCQRKLAGLQMVTPRGWGEGRRRREGVGKSPNPSRIIYSYIHISFYSKEHRVACPLSCAIFVNAGSLLVTSEQNSILCQGVDYICPPKFQHVFIRELFFFYFFFSAFCFESKGYSRAKALQLFFLSPSTPSFFRVTFCLTKDVKKHTQKNRLFFCVQSLRSPSLVYMQTICAPTQPMDMKGSWNN